MGLIIDLINRIRSRRQEPQPSDIQQLINRERENMIMQRRIDLLMKMERLNFMNPNGNWEAQND